MQGMSRKDQPPQTVHCLTWQHSRVNRTQAWMGSHCPQGNWVNIFAGSTSSLIDSLAVFASQWCWGSQTFNLQVCQQHSHLENVSAVLFGKPYLPACHHCLPSSCHLLMASCQWGGNAGWKMRCYYPGVIQWSCPAHGLHLTPATGWAHPTDVPRRCQAMQVHHSQGIISSFICLHHSWPCLCRHTCVPALPGPCTPAFVLPQSCPCCSKQCCELETI